jgi:hypothetical protein
MLSNRNEEISTDILAVEILKLGDRSGKKWNINGHNVTLLVEKI